MAKISKLAEELNINKEELEVYIAEKGYRVKNGNIELRRNEIENLKNIFNKEQKTKKIESKESVSKNKQKFTVNENSTVKDFSETIGKNPSEIIALLFQMGEMVTINQVLSKDEMNIIAEELGIEVEFEEKEIEEEEGMEAPEGEWITRPPVVTVMGHVDHGKTKLLDAIRKTDVVSGEAGGITQHIGAYQINHNGKKITFIDTPGHETFTAMRARGAKITDIVVLVVAADDGVKPQTIEAIDHAKAAGVPIIVAVNKIDKEGANPDKVRQQLAQHDLSPEEWGGKTVFVDVSAKAAMNIDELIDMILLVSEMGELKAVSETPAQGVVIEAKIDKGRGPVASVLVEHGKLIVGNNIVSGTAHGKVRALFNDRGVKVKEATPSEPVEIIGFTNLPNAGDKLKVVADEREAKSIADQRALKERIIKEKAHRHITLDDLHAKLEEGKLQELNLVVKTDVKGSIEALQDALGKLDQSEVRIKVIHSGVGAITETDVMLSTASDAILVGFNVRPDIKAKQMAEKEAVDIRTYKVIYQLIEDINSAKIGMLKPTIEEVVQGEAEVRETFKVPKIGLIAGCIVNHGTVNRNAKVRVIREGVVINETVISSLRRFKNDVTEVKEGYECGIGLDNFQDIKIGDVFEFFVELEKPREE